MIPRESAAPSQLRAWRFDEGRLDEFVLNERTDLAKLHAGEGLLWLEVTGLSNAAAIAEIGRVFGLHELSLEDALDPTQRAKVEQYQDYTFLVLHALSFSKRIETRPLNLFFGERFVVTLQDHPNPALDPIRERLRNGRGKLRNRGPDYLTYALIDAIVDHYYPAVEAFDDYLEQVEDAVLEAVDDDPIGLARRARQDLQTIRHAVWPARDVVTSLLHEDTANITDETRVHLRDCYDHLVQLQEMVESSREIAASLLDAYLSRVSLRTNEVMKVLTVVATIFIPLSFITSWYGMNFNPRSSPLNMPELDWYWGYPFAVLLMLATTTGAILYFVRKGWFGGRRH